MEKRERPESKNLQEDRYRDFEPAPAPTMSPEGVINVGFVGAASPAPAWTPEEVICARGPCRHLWVLKTTVGEGNPVETWKELGIPQPRQLTYTCLVNPGMETEFGDDAALDCNRWDPLTEEETSARDARRRLYQIRVEREAPLERIEDVIDDEDQARVEDDVEIQKTIAAQKDEALAWFILGRGPREFEDVWAETQQKEEQES